MTLTIFGFIVAAIGLVLMFRGGVMEMLMLMMGCSLMGGSAAIILNSLGGSSVPPVQFALVFGIARIFLPSSGRLRQAAEALRANIFLVVYGLYGVVAATFGPLFFKGAMRVPPMRATAAQHTLFDTIPLAPSPQNITATVYIVGSCLAGLVAYVAMQERGSAQRYVKMGVIVAWIHIGLGLSAAVLKGTPFDQFVDFMRNANYAQTDQYVNGFVRITGIFTEPSAYVSFGFGWFVFLLECWLRDVMPRRTGPAAAAMGLVLFISTSSTAYVALAAYGLIFCLRALMFPQFVEARKGLGLAGAALVCIILVSTAAFMFPALVDAATKILRSATVDKQHSDSALQRGFWARIGLQAFVVSNGLGIGPGSFRSSSFVTAMLGSVGVVGTVALVGHVLRALKPLRISTYCGARQGQLYGEDAMIGPAAAWAAIGVLIPAAVVSPTCDPGFDFAILAGVALALRRPSVATPVAGAPSWQRFGFQPSPTGFTGGGVSFPAPRSR